ncbi:MAG: ABC transporter permease [Elusimicrobia bacterium]|nr:ABC transporter permease [Elusimicrobiota bacterium]
MIFAVIKLALRNVFRNRRRSGLTLASVIIGVAALFFIQSLIKSLQSDMVERSLSVFNSHIQIQNKDTEDLKIPEYSFGDVAAIEEALSRDNAVMAYSQRVLFTALLASAQNSVGTGVFAMEPEKEKQLTSVAQYIVEGRFLDAPKQVTIGAKVAKNLDVRVGEKLVLMAQNRQGAFEGKVLRVSGIYKTGSYTWDASIIYMHLKDAQELLAWGEDINCIAVKLKDATMIEATQERLAVSLEAPRRGLKILRWSDISSEIVHVQGFQDAVLSFMIGIVFIIVALGILNTMLMSLFERIREFGLMMALGAKRRDVALLLLMESAFLGTMGLAWGAAWGLSAIVVFHFVGLPLPLGEALSYFLPFEKVLYMRFAWKSHIVAVLLVILVSAIAGIIPAIRVTRLRAAEALRHV